MKTNLLITIFVSLFFTNLSHAALPSQVAVLPSGDLKINDKVDQHFRDNVQGFLQLTPQKYLLLTGDKMSLADIIKLKIAQQNVKQQIMKASGEEKMPKAAYIVLVICFLGFIPIGILSDWQGNDWWINLLLSLMWWVPGVIHGLITMKKYYK